jgi:orotate phosphoribosyltransferase
MKGDKVVTMLVDRLEERIPLKAEELAEVLCRLGTVSFRPTRQTMAHRQYPTLAVASPVFINTRPEPDGPLTARQVQLLGAHMALSFHENGYCICPEFVLAGVPHAGECLAESFLGAWPDPRNVVPVTLVRKPDELGFDICGAKHLMVRCRYGLLVDNASSTGITDGSATREMLRLLTKGGRKKNRGVRVDCLVLVDREEGAQEALRQIGVTLMALVTLKTVVKRAIGLGRVRAETIWPRLERFQEALHQVQSQAAAQ